MISKKIVYQNSVTIDNEQWFWSENYNALYRRDLRHGTIRRMSSYGKSKTAEYTKLVLYKNKLVALPYAAEKIMIFDIQSEQIRYASIGISELENGSINHEKFYGVVVKDNWLFMIGCKTAHILKFDMELEVTAGYVDLQAELIRKENGIGYLRDGTALGEQIVVPALYENVVFEIDIDNLKYIKKRIDKDGVGFSTVFKNENDVWLLPFDEGEIVQWNTVSNDIKRHNIAQLLTIKKGARNFLSVQKFDNKLWIIPRFGNRILSYNLSTNQFTNKNAVNTYFENVDKEWFGIADEKNGCDILILAALIDEIIRFNIEKDEIELIRNEMPRTDYLEFLNNKGKRMVIFEHDIPLNDYLEFICRI